MKRRIFLVCLFLLFFDCRSTNLLRLFSGNLPAIFKVDLDSVDHFQPFDFTSSEKLIQHKSFKRACFALEETQPL